MKALLVSLLTLVPGPAVAPDAEIRPRYRSKAWKEVATPWKHLELRDGRRFYRGPRLIRNHWPFLLAANEAERAEGYGYELGVSNAHQLLEPIRTREAAEELARLLAGGVVIEDRETYEAIRRAVTPLQQDAEHWRIKILERTPELFGIQTEKNADGFVVTQLVFSSSPDSALCIYEYRYEFPFDGPGRRTLQTWISGPPQSWQTMGTPDPEQQASMRAEVRRFRRAVTSVLSSRRTLKEVRSRLGFGESFREIRWKLGEPDRDVGSGVHIYVYDLADGTAVVFGVSNEEGQPHYGRHVSGVSDGGPGEATVGKTLETIYVKW